MVELNEVMSFIQVIKAGGFIQASRQFGTPKSTLSRHIIALEKRLNVTLIHRSTRKIQLTSLGESFYRRTVLIFKELEEAETLIHTEQKGTTGLVRITAPVDFGTRVLAKPLAKLSLLYPQLKFDVLLTDQVVDLIGEQVDIAIRAGTLIDSNFKVKKLFMETMRLVASPDYLEKNGRPQEPQDLAQLDCIVFAPHAGLLNWKLDNGKKTIQVKPNSKYKVSSLTMCIELAMQGLGIALVPTFMFRDSILTGELEWVLPDWETENRPIHLVWPQQSEIPHRIRLCIDFLAKEMSNLN